VIIAFAHSSKCSNRLDAGDVKRTFARGPLLGYTIACPLCRYPGQYLHDEVCFTEEGKRVTMHLVNGRELPLEHPEVLSMKGRPRCYGCAATLSLERNELVATPRVSG